MKEKISDILILYGLNKSQYKISITKGFTRQDNYRVDCFGVTSECKYILLYVENIETILIWKKEDNHEKCTVLKKKVLDALEQKKNYVVKGQEFKDRVPQRVYITNINNLKQMMDKIESNKI